MVGYGSSASSRLASYRGVLSRFVSSAGRYRDSYGRWGSWSAILVQDARRLYGDGDAGRAGDGQGMQQ
jgi:hypothetical protein